MAKKAKAHAPAAGPLRIDLGCGKNKVEGFVGADAIALPGVDFVVDLAREQWPWPDGSVDEARASHFLEHLTPPQRVHFANELHRVLKVGAKATISTPHWTHDCAYGDPTHQWPPLSGWTFLYWNRDWRKSQAPHADAEFVPGMLDCDFDWTVAGSWDQWLETRNGDMRMFAMQRYVNSTRDLIVTLTKK